MQFRTFSLSLPEKLLLMNLKNFLQKSMLTFFLLSIFQITVFAQNSDRPVYTSAEPPPAGIYLTVEDYLALKPQDSEIIFQHTAQMEGDGLNTFFHRKTNGKKGDKIDPKECFAASDGKTFYISYAGKWYKAIKTEGEYSFIARIGRDAVNLNQPGVQVTSISDGTSSISLEDSYRMGYSSGDGKWIPIERVRKNKK